MSRSSSDPGFVHLHVHSSYSLLEGAMTVAKVAKLAAADKMPAVALTDTGNLFGALEFSEKAAGEGVQPIVGAQLCVDFADEPPARPGETRRRGSLVLLAATERGYASLMRLVSAAHLDVPAGDPPHVTHEALALHAEGLIVLTGGPDGPVDRAIHAGREDLARARLDALHGAFGDRLYVEVQRHGLEDERATEPALVALAYAARVPLVATNEPYFAKAEDHEAHDALLALAEGRVVADPTRRQVSPAHRFLTRREMLRLFADLPEATANTVEIARRCSYRPTPRKPILPRYLAEGAAREDEAIIAQARAGLEARLAVGGLAPGTTEADYAERLEFELSVISRMGYAGYFLIVSDFIRWAKDRGIPVGPGRGSGAGSLVAWVLSITDLDPLRFGLLFERFLNPDRVSMPDFDIDFCMDRRDEVIAYVRERYGQDRVGAIITFGTLQARGVLRDVGRVLELRFGEVDKLTKLVPVNPTNPITLDQAIAGEPKLQEARRENPLVARVMEVALKLEGLHRHASTHAAGIVIADRPLTELVALYRDPRTGTPVTQFNMKWVEQAGLVKFDFLGLKTLTVLRTTLELLNQRGVRLDLSTLPLDDEGTYAMLRRGEAVGVFQLESAGMRKALVEMKVDRFEDIIALVALYRPGPMANIPVYCARKQGLEQPSYVHPGLENSLRETYGVIIYQEQVMSIARELAGYSLGEADLLRRAMGKKVRAEMEAQRARFVSGATERGVDAGTAETIFDLLARFADYGFNKSHAAAYALISYQTAWLKANHPVEFLAASMTHEMDDTDKLSAFRAEAKRLGIRVDPPSVQAPCAAFDVSEGAIRYALSALKGVGRHTADAIAAARVSGPFADLSDFARRVEPKAINKRTLETLTAGGAFDVLDPDRARVHGGAEGILAFAQRRAEGRVTGQSDMFGAILAADGLDLAAPADPWSTADRLSKEFDAVGFFLSGHPLDDYDGVIQRLRLQDWISFCRGVKSGVGMAKLAATVLDRAERRGRTSDNKIGVAFLSDRTGQYEAILFSEALGRFRDALEPGARVIVTLRGSAEGDDVRARIENVEPLDKAASGSASTLRVFLRDGAALPNIQRRLAVPGEGEASLILLLDDGGREVEVKLPGRYPATPPVAGAIKAIPGVVAVEHA